MCVCGIDTLLPLQPAPSPPDTDTISITIESFSVEPGSSLADDPTIAQLFVEYQFLSFNYGDLETVTVAKPPPGQSAAFNLKTGVVDLFILLVYNCMGSPTTMNIHSYFAWF